MIYTFLVPPPNVILQIPDTQTVGQLLLMECVVTTVRGISSSIDTIWKSDGVEIKRTFGASISSSTSSSILYRDFYISLLTTAEDGSVYQCEGVINTSPSLNAESSIILDVIGMLTFTAILLNLNCGMPKLSTYLMHIMVYREK